MNYQRLILTCIFLSFLFYKSTNQSIVTKVAQLIEKTHYKGFWFYDDDGNLVKASLTVPSIVDIDTKPKNRVFFSIHTKANTTGEVIYIDDEKTLNSTNFDPNKNTFIITHGWRNSNKSAACQLIKDAYLEHGDYNVIIVDWGIIAKSLNYGYCAAHVKGIGKYVATMIDFLVKQGIDPNTTTLVGHSLGAHVMGLAGYYAKEKVNFAFGLDPAYPLFYTASDESRISVNSANNVEIIHTNAGLLGMLNPVGHVDFYPNGGSAQPNCSIPISSCSHSRSYIMFAESINTPTGFFAKQCNSQIQLMAEECNGTVHQMGGVKNNEAYKGTFYLTTNGDSPYALGLEGS